MSRGTKRRGGNTTLLLDYHQRPFLRFTQELIKTGYNFLAPANIVRDYWRLLPSGPLDQLAAHQYVTTYANCVENEMAQIMRKRSVGYWLHLFRRIGPGPIGKDKRYQTILITRSILEAAAQKYGLLGRCPYLAPVTEVGIAAILSGLLMDEAYWPERHGLLKDKQLALTIFGPDNIREFYELEKLAYELWRC
jgi:hypothetical protein